MNALRRNRFFNRTYGVIVLVIGLSLMIGSPLWSEEDQSEFVNQLIVLLQDEGWTAGEVRDLVSQEVDWEHAEGANPDVVALGLQYARSENEKMELEPMEQALLAIELAQATIEMEAVGIGELSIAMTALDGVRDILTDIQAFRSGELTGKELGETIRTTMRDRMKTATRKHAQKRIDDCAREACVKGSEDMVPCIPSSDGESPGSDYWPNGM